MRDLRSALLLAMSLLLPAVAMGQPAPEGAIRQRTQSLTRLDGFIPLYWDAKQGKLLLEIARFDQELLYQVSLPAGIGSNPLGLDRGQLGPGAVVRFVRVGPRVLLQQPNYRFRALTSDPAEQRAVTDSFASSVLWGFTVEAEESDGVLVDATGFFLRDAHGVIARMRDRQQGRYRLDDSRSAIYLPRTKAFPRNTEVEATLTFVTEEQPGALVQDAAPTPEAVTVRQHHSFVELPPAGYTPRRLDPRVGYLSQVVYDYASPVTEPLEKRWILRHRLQKKDPSAARSEAVRPIVYYVDNGAPELIRQALIEGAQWWSKAFEAAGFINGFQVKVLPADADPMDLRYNVITWVHRSTRGWSYGEGVVDPRTGEILKGNVSLGSLRIRQNILIDSALVAGAGSRRGGDGCEFGDMPDVEALTPRAAPEAAVQAALARLRQLSAHEVGHTIGLEHNFAASTYGRGSVMDYPAPLVTISGGALDLSNAYGVGTGAYDDWAIRYGYADLPPGADEGQALTRIVEEGVAAGLLFVSDDDSRPAGSMHVLGSLWDNGSDPVAGLRHEMEVRRLALAGLDASAVPVGQPLSLLESRLLPIYLHHRYQLQAAAKVIGGARFSYAVRDAAGAAVPSPPLQVASPAEQRAALAAVLDAIEPSFLRLPAPLLALIPPRAFGYTTGTAEVFERRTGPVFDQIGAAGIAADFAVSALVHPQRVARLLEFNARDSRNPSAAEVLQALVSRAFPSGASDDSMALAIRRAVQVLVVTRLMDLGANTGAAYEARAVARAALRQVHGRIAGATDATSVELREDVGRFLAKPDEPTRRTPTLAQPQGEPIGN